MIDEKAVMGLRPIIRAVAFLVLAVLTAAPALADQWWQAVGYRCLAGPDHLIIYSVPYDANRPLPTTREGLFVHVPSKDPLAITRIAECPVEGRIFRLRRVYQNTPRASGGACAGANWARYELHRDDKLVARFDIGCFATTSLTANPNTVSLCTRGGCSTTAYRDDDLPLKSR